MVAWLISVCAPLRPGSEEPWMSEDAVLESGEGVLDDGPPRRMALKLYLYGQLQQIRSSP